MIEGKRILSIGTEDSAEMTQSSLDASTTRNVDGQAILLLRMTTDRDGQNGSNAGLCRERERSEDESIERSKDGDDDKGGSRVGLRRLE
jgi:hypothetical protein